jgi:hypothetical protein
MVCTWAGFAIPALFYARMVEFARDEIQLADLLANEFHFLARTIPVLRRDRSVQPFLPTSDGSFAHSGGFRDPVDLSNTSDQ